MADLKHIFAALVPENIKSIPLVETAMQIFMANLEENSSISWDIKNVYDTSILSSDSAIRSNAKSNLRDSLVYTYLQILQQTILEAQSNVVLIDKLAIRGITNPTIKLKTGQFLNLEHNTVNKQFKDKVGTLTGINFAHELARTLESNVSVDAPIITEVKPFHLFVESPLTSEMYSSIAAPLSHPVGFTYDYKQIVKNSLIDLFGLLKVYTINTVEIRGSVGTFDVFTPLSALSATESVWLDFKGRLNSNTGLLFTRSEFDTLVTVWANKTVLDIVDPSDTVNSSVLFSDNTFISNINDTDVQYVHYDLWLQGNATGFLIKDFSANAVSGHYSIFTNYTFVLKPSYGDVEAFDLGFDITSLNDLTGGVLPPNSTSDDTIMQNLTENLDVVSLSNGGNYLTNASTFYLVSSDGFYLTNYA